MPKRDPTQYWAVVDARSGVLGPSIDFGDGAILVPSASTRARARVIMVFMEKKTHRTFKIVKVRLVLNA